MHRRDFHFAASASYISLVSNAMISGFCWVGLLPLHNHPIQYLGSGSK